MGQKDNPNDAYRIGKWGERQAKQFLKQKKQFQIICQNWRKGFREIDLVAWDGPVMVFIEVRTRKDSAASSGYHSINNQKKAALSKVCKAYMRALKQPPKHFRFDVVEVSFTSDEQTIIHHYENVRLFHKDYRPQLIQ